jgi:hypothetical protein
MAWPRTDVRKAEVFEDPAKPHCRQIHAEALAENPLEVRAAPAHHPILLRIRASFHQPAQLFLLLRREPRGSASRFGVDETVRAMRIEAMDPIPQRLTVHTSDARCFFAIHPVVNRRQRQ